jgi:hypothetical protein
MPEAILTADESKSPAEVWPQTPAARGAVYGFIDPAWGSNMVALTMDTWADIMADVKVMKERLDQLSAENIELVQGRGAAKDPSPIILLNP